jgi:hypothetical protein
MVLDCVLKHFKKGFLGDYRINMFPGKMCMLCELELPTFGVSWHPEVTLELPTVRAIYRVIIGTPGLSDEFPHIDSWHWVAQTMPPWVQFCTNTKGQSRLFVAQVMKPKD